MLNKQDLITKIDEIVNHGYYIGRTSYYNKDIAVCESMLCVELTNLLSRCKRNGGINRFLLVKELKRLAN